MPRNAGSRTGSAGDGPGGVPVAHGWPARASPGEVRLPLRDLDRTELDGAPLRLDADVPGRVLDRERLRQRLPIQPDRQTLADDVDLQGLPDAGAERQTFGIGRIEARLAVRLVMPEDAADRREAALAERIAQLNLVSIARPARPERGVGDGADEDSAVRVVVDEAEL